jgi:hypothetical protein
MAIVPHRCPHNAAKFEPSSQWSKEKTSALCRAIRPEPNDGDEVACADLYSRAPMGARTPAAPC